MQAVAAPIIGALSGGSAMSLAAGALTAVGAVAQMRAGAVQSAYQIQAYNEMKRAEIDNAGKARFAASVNAQTQDEAAVEQIAAEAVAQAATGFEFNSPTFMRRRVRTRALALRDRSRTIYQGEVEAADAFGRARSYAYKAAGAEVGRGADRISAMAGIGTSLLDTVSRVNQDKAGRIARQAQAVG